jgi:hypothetical protein
MRYLRDISKSKLAAKNESIRYAEIVKKIPTKQFNKIHEEYIDNNKSQAVGAAPKTPELDGILLENEEYLLLEDEDQILY